MEVEIKHDDGGSVELPANPGDLSKDEMAYFESRGEKPIPGADAQANVPDVGNEGGETKDGEAAEKPLAKADDGQAKPDGKDEGQEDRRVPYGALREERQRRQALEQQLSTLTEKFTTFQQQFQSLQPKPAQPGPDGKEPAAEEKVPSVEEDFFAALEWTQKQLLDMRKTQSQREQEARQHREQQERTIQEQRFVATNWKQAFEDAKQRGAPIEDAYRHLREQRYNELRVQGYDHENAVQQVNLDEYRLIRSSLQNRQHPAQRILQLAQVRGWRPPQAQQQAPSAEAAQQAAPDAAQPTRLDTIARGQESNKSLSGVGSGSAGRSRIDAKGLAEMSDADFAKLISTDAGQKAFRQVAGG